VTVRLITLSLRQVLRLLLLTCRSSRSKDLVCRHNTPSPLILQGFLVDSRELACEVPEAA
jgi:hypothetical protein